LNVGFGNIRNPHANRRHHVQALLTLYFNSA